MDKQENLTGFFMTSWWFAWTIIAIWAVDSLFCVDSFEIPFIKIKCQGEFYKKILFFILLFFDIILSLELYRVPRLKKKEINIIYYKTTIWATIVVSVVSYSTITEGTQLRNLNKWMVIINIICWMIFFIIIKKIVLYIQCFLPIHKAARLGVPPIPRIVQFDFFITAILLGFLAIIYFSHPIIANVSQSFWIILALIFYWLLFLPFDKPFPHNNLKEILGIEYFLLLPKRISKAYKEMGLDINDTEKQRIKKISLLWETEIQNMHIQILNCKSIPISSLRLNTPDPFLFVKWSEDAVFFDCQIPVELINEAIVFVYARKPKISNKSIFELAIKISIFAIALIHEYLQDSTKRVAIIQKLTFNGPQFLIKILLSQRSCNLNELQKGGWFPLLAAAAQNEIGLVKLFLKNGANPDLSNLMGITPLMYAARYNHLEICKILVSSYAKIDAKDMHGDTALMVALQHKSFAVANFLIQSGANLSIVNKNRCSVLKLAYQSKDGTLCQQIREKIIHKN